MSAARSTKQVHCTIALITKRVGLLKEIVSASSTSQTARAAQFLSHCGSVNWFTPFTAVDPRVTVYIDRPPPVLHSMQLFQNKLPCTQSKYADMLGTVNVSDYATWALLGKYFRHLFPKHAKKKSSAESRNPCLCTGVILDVTQLLTSLPSRIRKRESRHYWQRSATLR